MPPSPPPIFRWKIMTARPPRCRLELRSRRNRPPVAATERRSRRPSRRPPRRPTWQRASRRTRPRTPRKQNAQTVPRLSGALARRLTETPDLLAEIQARETGQPTPAPAARLAPVRTGGDFTDADPSSTRTWCVLKPWLGLARHRGRAAHRHDTTAARRPPCGGDSSTRRADSTEPATHAATGERRHHADGENRRRRWPELEQMLDGFLASDPSPCRIRRLALPPS